MSILVQKKEGEEDVSAADLDAQEEAQLSPQDGSSFNYCMLGYKFNRRLPLPPPREQKLHDRLTKLQGKVETKILECEERGDKQKTIMKKIKLWAIIAVKDHKFEFEPVKIIRERYERLGLVPQGYNYPEFYQF